MVTEEQPRIKLIGGQAYKRKENPYYASGTRLPKNKKKKSEKSVKTKYKIRNCQICGIEFNGLFKPENHHLIPKSYRNGGDEKKTIRVCPVCGDVVHIMFTNYELANEFNTSKKILESKKMKKYIEWRKTNCDMYIVWGQIPELWR